MTDITTSQITGRRRRDVESRAGKTVVTIYENVGWRKPKWMTVARVIVEGGPYQLEACHWEPGNGETLPE